MTLGERSEIVTTIWPEEMNIGTRMNRCALVFDVEIGHPTASLSREEEARIREEIARRGPSRERPLSWCDSPR